MTQAKHLRQPTIWHYAACYALYAVVLALCFGAFWIWRSTIELLASFYFRRSNAFETVYLSTVLLVGLVLFAVVVGGEAYLRDSVRRGSFQRLVSRFVRVALPLAVVTGAGVLLQELLYKQYGL
jgi:membrane protein CcdC involved in cytochrome C biogenesis